MYLNTAEATTHIIRKNSSIEKSSNKKGVDLYGQPLFSAIARAHAVRN